jgi:hypothetical protein
MINYSAAQEIGKILLNSLLARRKDRPNLWSLAIMRADHYKEREKQTSCD